MAADATERPLLVVSNSSTDKVAYHVDEDCPALTNARYRDRSRRYIEFHDLDPCTRCAEEDDDD